MSRPLDAHDITDLEDLGVLISLWFGNKCPGAVTVTSQITGQHYNVSARYIDLLDLVCQHLRDTIAPVSQHPGHGDPQG